MQPEELAELPKYPSKASVHVLVSFIGVPLRSIVVVGPPPTAVLAFDPFPLCLPGHDRTS